MYHKFLGVNFLENLKSLTYPSIFELENSNFQEMFLYSLKTLNVMILSILKTKNFK